MKKIIITSILSILITCTFAQPSMDYWNNVGYLHISGGTVTPNKEFSSTSDNGLYAEDGFQFGIDYNHMIAAGFGIGINYEFNRFYFNKLAFLENTNPIKYSIGRGYRSNKFGLNALFNFPIIVSPEFFTINFYIEGNAGIRGMSIPSIDLEYDELVNKYVEVSYHPRTSTMGYIGYSGGVQLLISNRLGINVSYNALNPRRNSINYSVRMFDANGALYEDESYINNYLDHTGLQFGIMFIFGKRMTVL